MHDTLPLRGIIPPLVTPLGGWEVLDLAGLERLVNRAVEAGCTGVFVLGSTGEAQALSYCLRLQMVRETCQIVDGRVPVLAGVTDCSLAESIKFGAAAVKAGAAALVTATPFYFRMSQDDLLRHAGMLAKETPVPLFLYNMPGLTKLAYEPETVAAASEIPNIVGFKDSSGDLIYLQRVLRLVRHKPGFSVLVGPEELLGAAIMLGAHGGISGGANLRPRLYVDLYKAAVERRLEDLHCLERRVIELSECVYRVGDPATSYFRGLKCALEMDGICNGQLAPPLIPLSEHERNRIGEWLRQ